MKVKVKKKHKFNQQSIYNYLGLGYRSWFLEFEIGDFGASFANLLELPQEIYHTRKKEFFWLFMKSFLQKPEISFILRQPNPKDSTHDRIDLALLGFWENKQFAIPLWILKNLLLGFEIIPSNDFIILDSEPLIWSQPVSITKRNTKVMKNQGYDIFILKDDFFQDQKIYFKLEGNQIFVSQYFNELEFFNRIAQTSIPELDESDNT